MTKVYKKIEIEIPTDAGSDLADILCFMHGYIEGKGEDFKFSWLKDSLQTLSDINLQIKSKSHD